MLTQVLAAVICAKFALQILKGVPLGSCLIEVGVNRHVGSIMGFRLKVA